MSKHVKSRRLSMAGVVSLSCSAAPSQLLNEVSNRSSYHAEYPRASGQLIRQAQAPITRRPR
jgi:hypothetical protein